MYAEVNLNVFQVASTAVAARIVIARTITVRDAAMRRVYRNQSSKEGRRLLERRRLNDKVLDWLIGLKGKH
jgi:hypothetical protein